MFDWLKRTINKSLFGINVFFSGLLLLSYLAAYVPPSTFYYLAILALGYPYLLLINILFAGWWLYRRKRYFYLSLVCMVIGYSYFLNFFAFNFVGAHAEGDRQLKVMSYNVRYFDAPFYQKKQIDQLDKAHQSILNIIKEQGVDIFCGQEFSGKTMAYNKRSEKELAHKMGLKYHYQAGGSSLAIFSKYPILKKGAIAFKGTYNGAIFADIKIEDEILRVYCFHLQSVRLSGDEKQVLKQENITTLNQNETQEKYKKINGKLKNAFLLREQQVKFIHNHITNSPYPVIVCGDMNDTPSSYAYHCLSDGMKDAFSIKGAGWGSTYAGSIPFLRIDYAFVSPDLSLQAFQVIDHTTSDHYPIYTQIRY
jgi:endonuclease/exonuclease/phosphatase family metal-dependent hydrolase